MNRSKRILTVLAVAASVTAVHQGTVANVPIAAGGTRRIGTIPLALMLRRT